MPDDLWGMEFGKSQEKSAPYLLLEEQAKILAARTSGRVHGEVIDNDDFATGTSWVSLYASVPSASGYRFKIVSISYELYADPVNPVPMQLHSPGHDGKDDRIMSMDELRSRLKQVLSSPGVHHAVDRLIRVSKERVAS